MLKFISAIGLCIAIINVSHASVATLKAYIQVHKPIEVSLTNRELEQIAWVVDHSNRSHEQDIQTNTKTPHIEIDRALTRLYCLKLLRNPNYSNYLKFVKPQIDANLTNPLTYAGYLELSKFFNDISEADYIVLRKAVILTAVSLTKQSLQNTRDLKNLTINDNLQFLAACLRSNPQLFPILEKFHEEQVNLKKIFYTIFPFNTNFRHMLYTENGENMFVTMRQMIKHGYLTELELRLWYAYWIINVSGFRGHINHNGSLYLNEQVYKSMQVLYQEINKMLQIPNYQPLYSYLEYRASIAGFANLPKQEKYTLAHLASLLRIYDIENGRKLYQAYLTIPAEERIKFQQNYWHILQGKSNVYITHFPALLGNALSSANGNYSLVLTRIVALHNQLIKKLQTQISQRRISLNMLSATGNVTKLLQKTNHELHINENDELVLN